MTAKAPKAPKATYNPIPDWTLATVTLDGTLATVNSMLAYRRSHTTPSLRLAVWGAILSPKNVLSANSWQLDTLRPYAMGGLPHDVATVEAIMRASGYTTGMLGSKAKYIIASDKQIASGDFAMLLTMPTTADGWYTWRMTAKQITGLGYKTASMVAMVMWPHQSPLVPVDSHVATRLGLRHLYDSGKLNSDYATYAMVEQLVVAEHYNAVGASHVSPVVWHWYKWSQWRQATKAELPSVQPESHDLLSPYAY